MAKIRKFHASVDYCSAEAYHLTALHESFAFSIPAKTMHGKAVFPDNLYDGKGRLRIGATIAIVAKMNSNGDETYYPDTTVYTERYESSGVTKEEYASSLLNLLDHSHEIDLVSSREIVEAIATSSADLACKLIRKALFK